MTTPSTATLTTATPSTATTSMTIHSTATPPTANPSTMTTITSTAVWVTNGAGMERSRVRRGGAASLRPLGRGPHLCLCKCAPRYPLIGLAWRAARAGAPPESRPNEGSGRAGWGAAWRGLALPVRVPKYFGLMSSAAALFALSIRRGARCPAQPDPTHPARLSAAQHGRPLMCPAQRLLWDG